MRFIEISKEEAAELLRKDEPVYCAAFLPEQMDRFITKGPWTGFVVILDGGHKMQPAAYFRRVDAELPEEAGRPHEYRAASLAVIEPPERREALKRSTRCDLCGLEDWHPIHHSLTAEIWPRKPEVT